ncbi:M48 family metallopeptidase [Colwellia sp. MB3u-28]|nr:M48 family metallopeptidase [Colwellia sp. MB02u-7]MBA6237929.1 M48 family metallopeptidase [Colwellia sp. MB02u-11]MBA6257758.1 M48 family metallopeptidase [Colwellia sp. MB3u-28]MBA6259515.1 M48 family metallopeptidase [Colwellia sp. MB3u-41]MBA6300823.1 M48 family metallopeptidase [Colwellia sp. MB3u-22]MBA6304282.1 M48 family metallopeptidase [Colwellia sp. MB02u-14]MBA6311278.1 M48 family metallopeptidase [Colwellia sp. MB3u-64]
MMRHIRASQPLINDPVLNEYINDLGNRLVKNAQDVNYSFEFFIIRNKEINAFAFFGGHVGIHSGLMTLADTESELASVIGHEISHVTQRHLARRLEAQRRNQPLTTAAMISGVLLALVNPSVGMAALTTTMAASQQSSINFTRGNEQEADRVGITLLAQSGFDPQGAPDFFGKMATKYRYTSKPPAMLLTHPVPESRIADARIRAHGLESRPSAPSLDFALAKARIQARYESTPQENIATFEDDIKKQSYTYKVAVNYGLALSLFENKDYQDAKKILEKLISDDKNNLFYADALTDVYIKTKEIDKALVMLNELNLLMPNNQVVTLNYANALLENEKFSAAEVLLQDFLLVKPGNFIAYDILTTVYQKQDKKALMHATKGEVFALLGAYSRAVDELQTGYNFTENQPIVEKRIKARILQLQDQEQKLKRL